MLQCEPAFRNSAVGYFFSGGLFKNTSYVLADVSCPLTLESPWVTSLWWEWRGPCAGQPAAEVGVRHSEMPSFGTDLQVTTPDPKPTPFKVGKTWIHPRNHLLALSL